MRRREAPFAWSTVLGLLVAFMISPTVNPMAATDTVAPAAIVLLTPTAPSTAPQLHMTLSWTAPGDDGNIGTAASYDIRFRTGGPLTEASWGSAAQVTYGMDSSAVPVLVTTEPTPQSAGTVQSFTVVGLKPNTTYYWAIKATDEAGNTSGISNSVSKTTTKYEGYGYQSIGGGEQPFCEVTNLNDSGAGSFRNCLGDNKYIVFRVGGTINMGSTLDVGFTNITVDGSTAPNPGVTFSTTVTNLNDGFKLGAGTGQTRSHQIVTYLRFKGLMEFPPYYGSGTCPNKSICGCKYCEDIFSVLAYNGGAASHIVVDHITTEYVEDSATDFAGAGSGTLSDVTYSNNFVWRNAHDQLMDISGSRISLHHNLYSENMDRSPRFQKTMTDVDFVNNLQMWYCWDPSGSLRQYLSPNKGLALTNEASNVTNLNVVNNYFVPWPCSGISGCADKSGMAIVYGLNAGWDSQEGGTSYSGCKKQGTVWTGGSPMSGAQVWVSGNVFPTANCDEYSTITSPRPTPLGAQITMDSPANLWATVLPSVGTRFPTPEEQTLINNTAAVLHPGAVCGNSIKEPGETCDGSDLGGSTCVSQGFTGGGTLRCDPNCINFDTSQCLGNTPPGDVQNLHRMDTTAP